LLPQAQIRVVVAMLLPGRSVTQLTIQSIGGPLMKNYARRTRAFLALCVVLFLSTYCLATPAAITPNPIVIFMGAEPMTIDGVSQTRYHFDVFNKDSYPADMFAASPNLPPCGKNTKASRTWVDIYDQTGKRLFGFCALGKLDDLNGIYFSLSSDMLPPSWVYIEFTDRQTNTKYKSNLVETVM
jgi:hypothetical protein